MAYVKQKVDPLRRLLNAYELNKGRQLGAVIGTPHCTAYKRIKCPEDLTVRELRMLSRKGHIPIEEIRNAL